MDQNPSKTSTVFIDWLRLYAMVSIVLCHLVQFGGETFVSIFAQFFNIGVQIFFLISGFCFGLQGEIKDLRSWYLKRAKKIYFPYELFMIVLMLVYVAKPLYFQYAKTASIVRCFLGIQGAYVKVLGANQTWYITAILIFYLVLPWLSKLWYSVKEKSRYATAIFVASLFVLFSLTYFLFDYGVTSIVAPVFMCTIAYIMGAEFNRMPAKKFGLPVSILTFALFMLMRLLVTKIENEHISNLLLGWSVYGVAFSIFFIVRYVFKNAKKSSVVSFFVGISFEVYLYHYMFIEGPIFLMHKTGNAALNVAITLIVTFAVSFVANRIIKYLNIFLDRKFRKEMK